MILVVIIVVMRRNVAIIQVVIVRLDRVRMAVVDNLRIWSRNLLHVARKGLFHLRKDGECMQKLLRVYVRIEAYELKLLTRSRDCRLLISVEEVGM